jgi:hypothetical protein
LLLDIQQNAIQDKNMKKAVWMSFDLGLQGDYESLFQWLDSQGAIECGENVAFFNFECADAEKLPEMVTEKLKAIIKEDPKTRIYIVWRQGGNVKGRFVFGRRKAPPWAGYAPKPVTEEQG